MELEALCLCCGMCCDGTLFELVSVSAAEAAALEARNVAVGIRLANPVLALPCAARTADHGCVAYAHRPQSCRRFICALARGLEVGRLSLADAKAVVAEGRRKESSERSGFLREHFLG